MRNIEKLRGEQSLLDKVNSLRETFCKVSAELQNAGAVELGKEPYIGTVKLAPIEHPAWKLGEENNFTKDSMIPYACEYHGNNDNLNRTVKNFRSRGFMVSANGNSGLLVQIPFKYLNTPEEIGPVVDDTIVGIVGQTREQI